MADFRQKILNGDIEGVERLLKMDPTIINKPIDGFGITPLMLASQVGADRRIIDILIKAGAKLEAKDRGGQTALHWAVFGNHLQAVEILLSRGSEVNPRNEYGQTLLHWACYWGSLHTVELLLGHNGIDANVVANNGDTPLHEAVRGCKYEVVSVMLSKGSVQLDIQNNQKRTPLLEAVSQGHLGMTHKLIALGANINAVDGEGNSCLHLAVERKVFDSKDAPLDLLNECCTSLNLKEDEMLSGVVVGRYLASQGADFHHKNNKYNTPLDLIKDPNLRRKLEAFLPPQCLWCRNKAATTKVHPCGHLVICKGCSNVTLQRCLKCGKPVTSRTGDASPKFADKGVQTDLQLLEPTSEQSDAKKLEEKDLLKVARQLGSNWWQAGIFLGIKSIQLGIIRHDFSGNVQEQSFQMLVYWSTHCDPQEVTVDTLRAALVEAECLTALESQSLLEE